MVYNDNDDSMDGCALMLAAFLFFLFVSIAVGILVGAWAGCLVMAVGCALFFVVDAVVIARDNRKAGK